MSFSMDLSSLRVALIQMRPEPLDAERNLETAVQHIIAAAEKGAYLAVLPEYHLSGWYPEDPKFRVIASQAKAYLERYQQLARRCKINIVPGTILSLPHSGDALLNKTYFISHTGDILGDYTKVNLWHPEREHLLSGPDYSDGDHEVHRVFETPIGPVGLLICYDLCFPEASRALTRAGAKIIIIPTFTKRDDPNQLSRSYNQQCETLFVESALVTRAFENGCCVVFCNVGGPGEDNFMGLSRVILPIVGVVSGSFFDSREGFSVMDVDMRLLDVAENNYMIRRDLKRPGFHYNAEGTSSKTWYKVDTTATELN